jgi:tetratricopeptide (TPR) repeat protein
MNRVRLSIFCWVLLVGLTSTARLAAAPPAGKKAATPLPAPVREKAPSALLPLTGFPSERLSTMVPELPAPLPSKAANIGGSEDGLFASPAADPSGPSVAELQSLLGDAMAAAANAPSVAPPTAPAPVAARPSRPPTQRTPPTPEQERLLAVARKVAPAIVFLRTWDAYGNELANGCGFFMDDQGAILTSVQVVHPEFAQEIEYISVGTGAGTFHRITGFWFEDQRAGLVMLQSDARDTPFLVLKPGEDFSKERDVSIVALHAEAGLTLADAKVKADTTKVGDGWLNLRGDDSPGEPGSPVIDGEGRVVALVSMRVPQGKWVNFGIRVDAVVKPLTGLPGTKVSSLSRLARGQHRVVTDDARFVEAFRSLYDGQTKRGASQLLLLVKEYPRSAEVWGLLSLAYSQVGAKEEALNCSRKAVALDPRVGKFWQQLAVSHLDSSGGKADPAAREALERTVEEQPADKLAWLLLAEQQLLAGQFPAAEKALVEVIKLEPDYAPASFLMGYAKARQGDYASAESALQRCIKLDRNHTRAWFYLGLLYAKQKRLPDAARAYERVVAIQPNHPHAWRNLALVERKLGHDTVAQQAIERHLKLGAPAK